MIRVTGHGRLVRFDVRQGEGRSRYAEAVIASPRAVMGDIVADDLVFITLLDPMIQQFITIGDAPVMVYFSGQARPSTRFFNDRIESVIEVLPSTEQNVSVEPIYSYPVDEITKKDAASRMDDS